MDEQALRELADERLRALAGPEASLREDQWSAIRALVLERRRALVVQRTGWGKSAVYFIATALLRELGEGPTVIVSPLLALMRNQVEAAAAADVHAATINSANPEEWADIEERVAAGEVDVLLVSPERLNNPDFRDTILPELTQNAGLLVVDEAHCISDWGHDFRPDYRRLRTLLTELPEGVPVLATTATANDRVVQDVADQLGVGGEHTDPRETLVLRGTLDRESLRLGVVRLPSAEARLGWLASHLKELPGSGIIYTLTVAATEEISAYLRDQGYEVASYSGRTDPAERQQAEADLLANKVKALVATSALGMGFDKPDLGFVVHLGAPSSPIAYYQQIGRAGRGVQRAEVLLLPGPEDRDIWSYFASLAFPPEPTVRAVLDALAQHGKMSTAALEPHVELGRSRLEMVLKVLDVDGAVQRVKGGWEATGEPWHYDAERYRRIAAERKAEQQAMLDYLGTSTCRMEFLRRQLDDAQAAPCGRCDNCTGTGYSSDVDDQAVQQAEERLRRPGVEVSPRKMWPSGMNALDVPLSGKLPADEQAGTGRAVGRLTDIGWGNRLRDLLATGAPDQQLPDDLFQAAIKVLAAWDWQQRPVGVVALGSRTRPVLVRSLAERIAGIGRLPLLGEVLTNPNTTPRSGTNSAQRVASLWSQFKVPEELAAKLSALDGPVLLMDDYADTGWTITVVSRLLRQAGAPSVLPFTLATTS
ncbi:ATP-dependent DNA helicase RecQ [Saccharopolyspora kobensis]|uniref:ATP-dependent DNA helicase RecQ n=1 Tax=Saccharopolyspora kobensis TaxID=146035 RepID=A0A1H6E4W5_9PSEU|nr:RecQ family ATP-dependent DNA helicase [Saccharopolyspora kobensis]SEG92730.1 ATP-dependent DNA helicase RecQ [Saccharopolyspora kobensis]SFD40010.1 ATP-dependent DNA helicase RecQ [Saccharopolyspora kobensis]